MKIESKYNIGDKVSFYRDEFNNCQAPFVSSGKILEIDILDDEIYYKIEKQDSFCGFNGFEKISVKKSVKEIYVFPVISKREKKSLNRKFKELCQEINKDIDKYFELRKRKTEEKVEDLLNKFYK